MRPQHNSAGPPAIVVRPNRGDNLVSGSPSKEKLTLGKPLTAATGSVLLERDCFLCREGYSVWPPPQLSASHPRFDLLEGFRRAVKESCAGLEGAVSSGSLRSLEGCNKMPGNRPQQKMAARRDCQDADLRQVSCGAPRRYALLPAVRRSAHRRRRFRYHRLDRPVCFQFALRQGCGTAGPTHRCARRFAPGTCPALTEVHSFVADLAFPDRRSAGRCATGIPASEPWEHGGVRRRDSEAAL